jgi:Ca2+-binding EF-hand superfamily protein
VDHLASLLLLRITTEEQRESNINMRITDEQMGTLRASFKKYDKNNDNAIDRTELLGVLRDNGVEHPEAIVNEVLNAMDRNHDGTVSQ